MRHGIRGVGDGEQQGGVVVFVCVGILHRGACLADAARAMQGVVAGGDRRRGSGEEAFPQGGQDVVASFEQGAEGRVGQNDGFRNAVGRFVHRRRRDRDGRLTRKRALRRIVAADNNMFEVGFQLPPEVGGIPKIVHATVPGPVRVLKAGQKGVQRIVLRLLLLAARIVQWHGRNSVAPIDHNLRTRCGVPGVLELQFGAGQIRRAIRLLQAGNVHYSPHPAAQDDQNDVVLGWPCLEPDDGVLRRDMGRHRR